MNKRTVVIGASTNPSRYAFKAANMLRDHEIDFVAIGLRDGEVAGESILPIKDKPQIGEVDTVTMYIGPLNQPFIYDYIFSLNPKRIIFNPGTENPEMEKMAIERGISVDEACTLVLLQTGQY